MTTTLSEALSLMIIGMITVFLVLSLVYATGIFLIKTVNRWFPLSEKESETSFSAISPKKLVAITAAVDHFTQGRGRITKIEKHLE